MVYNGVLAAFLADVTMECDADTTFWDSPGSGTFGDQHLLILGIQPPSDCEDPLSDCAVGSFDGELAYGYYLPGEVAWQSETGTIEVGTATSSRVTGMFDLLGQVAPGRGAADTAVTGSFSASARTSP